METHHLYDEAFAAGYDTAFGLVVRKLKERGEDRLIIKAIERLEKRGLKERRTALARLGCDVSRI